MRAVMRRNEAHERSGGGAGLGLAIVKSIMSALGGTARAESEAGKGCTIVLAVPEARRET
ncbi:ATP-binding protein [Treponema socranskii]|uniref:ATP-binding protein n=1 Tax=Treponema socranskii TaxID=53419 RepID=UPI003D6DC02F